MVAVSDISGRDVCRSRAANDVSLTQLCSNPNATNGSLIRAPSPRNELATNDFNLLVDRYVVDPELRQQRQALAKQETIPLGDLAEFYRPQAFALTLENRHAPLGQIIAIREVATGNIHDGFVERPAKEIEISAGDVDRIKRAILKSGDVLISVKGKVGVVGVVPEFAPKDISGDWIAGQTFVIARLRRSAMIKSPAILARYLTSLFGQAQLQALAGGTTVPLIQMSDLRRLAIPLPTAEIQTKIALQIDEITKLHEQIHQIHAKIAQAEQELSHLFVEPPKENATSRRDGKR